MTNHRSEPESYSPMALIGVTIIALLGFAVFFLSFLVAPLAILLIFYVGFAASDHSRRPAGNGHGGEGRRSSAEVTAGQAPTERQQYGDGADRPPLHPVPRS